MRNLMNKMLTAVGFADTADEYEDDFEETAEDYEEPLYERFSNRVSDRRSSNVVKLHNTGNQMRVIVIQPDSFDDAKEVTNHLKSKKPIVINLEAVEKNDARRIIDFLSGAVYALDGDIQKISNGIFIIAPNNVDIMSDELKATTSSFSFR